MNLDLRLPIGVLFSLFGVILVAYGLFTPAEVYRQSLGINVNLWWGLVLLAFGGVMLTFALRARSGVKKT
jgi:hypothetical protein